MFRQFTRAEGTAFGLGFMAGGAGGEIGNAIITKPTSVRANQPPNETSPLIDFYSPALVLAVASLAITNRVRRHRFNRDEVTEHGVEFGTVKNSFEIMMETQDHPNNKKGNS